MGDKPTDQTQVPLKKDIREQVEKEISDAEHEVQLQEDDPATQAMEENIASAEEAQLEPGEEIPP